MPVTTRTDLTHDVSVQRIYSVKVGRTAAGDDAWLEIENRDGPNVVLFMDYHVAAEMAAAYWNAVAKTVREAGL